MMTSLLGFWSRGVRIGDKGKVKVYPNYQPVLSYALMAMAHRQEHTGIIRKNRAGPESRLSPASGLSDG